MKPWPFKKWYQTTVTLQCRYTPFVHSRLKILCDMFWFFSILLSPHLPFLSTAQTLRESQPSISSRNQDAAFWLWPGGHQLTCSTQAPLLQLEELVQPCRWCNERLIQQLGSSLLTIILLVNNSFSQQCRHKDITKWENDGHTAFAV